MDYYLPEAFETAEQWSPENEPEISWSDFDSVVPYPPGPHELQIKPRQPESFAGLAVLVAEEFSTTFCERPFSEIMIRDQEEVLPCPWHGKRTRAPERGPDSFGDFPGVKSSLPFDAIC